MISVQGYFEGDRFFPEQQVKIPQYKRAIVTILDEPTKTLLEREREAWLEFAEAIRECDEPLEGEPERIHFDRVLDL